MTDRHAAWMRIKALAEADADPTADVHARALQARHGRALTARLEVRPDVSPSRTLYLVCVVLVLVLIAALLSGCVAPAHAVKQAGDKAAMCHGLALNETESPPVRRLAAIEERDWLVQFHALTGRLPDDYERWEPLPDDLRVALPPEVR